jgi:hypothetical protein
MYALCLVILFLHKTTQNNLCALQKYDSSSVYPDPSAALRWHLYPDPYTVYDMYPNPSAATLTLIPPCHVSWPSCCCLYPDPSAACILTTLDTRLTSQLHDCLYPVLYLDFSSALYPSPSSACIQTSTVCILTSQLRVSWPLCCPVPCHGPSPVAFIQFFILTFLRPFTLNLLRSVSWPLSSLYPDPSAALYHVLVNSLLHLSCSVSWLFCGLLPLTIISLYPDL